MIKRKFYLERIRPFINKDLIKVITGIRRSGKSVLLNQIKSEILKLKVPEENIIYYNFEDYSNKPLLDSDSLYDEIITKTNSLTGKIYLLFDEIQEVRDWEKVINSFRLNENFDIYLTGSNAKLLSSDLATYIAGRYIEFKIYPFTFSEFLELYLKNYPDTNIDEIFNIYLDLGGMPYLGTLDYNLENSNQYLRDLYNSVFIKDILKRNSFRDIDLLERIINFILANNGQFFSANSIVKYLKNENRKVAIDTVLNYLKACEEAYLISRLKKENVKGKKNLKANDKVYLADHGLANSIIKNDINQILESIVLNELLKRGYSVSVGDNNSLEVDFVAKKDNKKLYIQVCYLLVTDEVKNREFNSLLKIKDNYPKIVVSMDKIDFSRDGIIHQNIIDFLLEENW